MDILEIQLNTSYYEAGLLAIRSFRDHNPEFSLRVREFGLDDTQIRELSRQGRVISASRFDGSDRFPHVIARMNAFLDLEPDDGLTLFLDADTVTNQSIHLWKEMLCGSAHYLSMVREAEDYPLCAQVDSLASCIFPKLTTYNQRPGYNWGVILVKRSERSVLALKKLAQYYLELVLNNSDVLRYFRFFEQTFGNCYLLENDVPVLEVDGRFNSDIRTGRCTARSGRFLFGERSSYITHFIASSFRQGETAVPNPNDLFGLYRIFRDQYAQLGSSSLDSSTG